MLRSKMLRSKTMRSKTSTPAACQSQSGFSLIELMITLAVLLAVSAIVLSLAYTMTMNQATIANRTDMHASIRGVTEMLQQEISQAGRITWPATAALCGGTAGCEFPFITTTGAVTVLSVDVTVSDASVLFPGERLIVGIGCPGGANDHSAPAGCEEIITVPPTYGGGTTINGVTFSYSHPAGTQVRPAGAFAEGILPTGDGNVLKMFGDINGDGNMVYIEYLCNPGTVAAPGDLKRIELPWNAGDVATATQQTLVTNLLNNPDGDSDSFPDPCFSFQQKGSGITMDGQPCVGSTAPGPDTTGPDNCFFALNVAVTLTARTEFQDPQTRSWNDNTNETKALLSVSPRNVFQAWQLSQMPSGADAPGQISGPLAHVQPTPMSIINHFNGN